MSVFLIAQDGIALERQFISKYDISFEKFTELYRKMNLNK